MRPYGIRKEGYMCRCCQWSVKDSVRARALAKDDARKEIKSGLEDFEENRYELYDDREDHGPSCAICHPELHDG